jgi:hypothetical protein
MPSKSVFSPLVNALDIVKLLMMPYKSRWGCAIIARLLSFLDLLNSDRVPSFFLSLASLIL